MTASGNSAQAAERSCTEAEQFERVQAMFWQAAELPAGERISWVKARNLPAALERQLIAAIESDIAGSGRSKIPDSASAVTVVTEICGDALHQRRHPEIPNYEILEEIGRGGMGIVYRARQFRPDRIVAIKMLRMGAFSSSLDIERFMHEANATSYLSHAAVVPVYEVGEIRGEPFIVMKFIGGDTLENQLKSDIPAAQAIRTLCVVARAIADAHAHGIIHRDLKPSNILIEQNTGVPWVMDFGLAKDLQATSHLTSAGDIMGTPGYMAPEQATGHADTVSPAADVYGLGAILYRILTGRPPIEAADGDFARTMQLIREHDVISPRERNRRVPRELDAICTKALETDPGRRYPNAGDFAADLQCFLDGKSIRAKSSGALTQLQRWSRHRPGLAVTVVTLLAFFTYHVIADLAGLLPNDESFKRSVSYAVPIALMNAVVFQWCLQRTGGASWTLYAWATGEVLLLSMVIFAGDGARSGLIPAMFVLIAASALRCRPLLIGYVAGLTMLSYGILWAHTVLVRQEIAGVLTGIPVLMAMALIGIVQYVTITRSSASFEARRDRNSGRI
ncbi:MAG: serine/threonine-protein kinase [Planctomycetia bacterium]